MISKFVRLFSVFFVLTFVFFVSSVSAAVSFCNDTDKGLNYGVLGKIYINNTLKFTDICTTSTILREGYCVSNTSYGIYNYSCPYGCLNGVCKPTNTSTCRDSDGGQNIYVKGLTDGRVNGIGSYFNDICVASNGGVCNGTSCVAVAEGYCNGNTVTNTLKQCPSGKCENGACTSLTNCTDSDGGKNYNLKGYIVPRSNPQPFWDYCQDSNILLEMTCDEQGGKAYNYTCPYGCLNGACKPSNSLNCSDTDGGDDHKIKGVVTSMFGNVWEDYCLFADALNDSSQKITRCANINCFMAEHSCTYFEGAQRTFDGVYYKLQNCSEGCYYGTCEHINLPSNCSDTDGGLNSYLFGKTTGIKSFGETVVESDSCDGDYLIERYCSGGVYVVRSAYKCPNGCVNGSCIFGSFCSVDHELDIISVQNDAGNIRINYNSRKGSYNISAALISDNKYTSCEPLEGAKCIPGINGVDLNCSLKVRCNYPKFVFENLRVEIWSDACYRARDTFNFALGYVKECSETDGGKNYLLRGQTAGRAPAPAEGNGWYIANDSCMSNGFDLAEHYCDIYDRHTFEISSCQYGCQNGACKSAPLNITCTDTDGGIVYNMFGIMTNATKRFDDYCWTNNYTLTEYFCSRNASGSYYGFNTDYSCPYGCLNGACKPKPTFLQSLGNMLGFIIKQF